MENKMENKNVAKKVYIDDMPLKTRLYCPDEFAFEGVTESLRKEVWAGFKYSINLNKKILNCDPVSVESSLSLCLQYGLVPGGRQECALIPYFNSESKKYELSFVPMINGLVKVAYNKAGIKSVNCAIIYQNDHFEYQEGTTISLVFKKNIFGNRGERVGGYAVITLADDSQIIEIMTFDEIEAIGKKAKTQKIWGQHWDEMARKTIIKRAFKRCPKNKHLSEIIKLDNALERPDYSDQNQKRLTDINNQLNDIEATDVIEIESAKTDIPNVMTADEIEAIRIAELQASN